MTRKQQAGGKDEPGGNTASGGGTATKTENIESQLKNVDINKVRTELRILFCGVRNRRPSDSENRAGKLAGPVCPAYLRGGRR